MGGRAALPLERPGDQSMTASAMNGLRLDNTEFPSLSGVGGTATIGARPNTLTLSMPLDAEPGKTTKVTVRGKSEKRERLQWCVQEEYPALPALDNQNLRGADHGPIGRSSPPVAVSTPATAELSAGAPTSSAQNYFHVCLLPLSITP